MNFLCPSHLKIHLVPPLSRTVATFVSLVPDLPFSGYHCFDQPKETKLRYQCWIHKGRQPLSKWNPGFSPKPITASWFDIPTNQYDSLQYGWLPHQALHHSRFLFHQTMANPPCNNPLWNLYPARHLGHKWPREHWRLVNLPVNEKGWLEIGNHNIYMYIYISILDLSFGCKVSAEIHTKNLPIRAENYTSGGFSYLCSMIFNNMPSTTPPGFPYSCCPVFFPCLLNFFRGLVSGSHPRGEDHLPAVMRGHFVTAAEPLEVGMGWDEGKLLGWKFWKFKDSRGELLHIFITNFLVSLKVMENYVFGSQIDMHTA